MDLVSLLPAALAAFGGYRGYRDARKQGVTGIGALARGALTGYAGYQLGTMATAKPGPKIPGLGAGTGDASVAEAVAAAFLSAGVCPLKVLVGANSPSLCPTISSDIVIGINVLPL